MRSRPPRLAAKLQSSVRVSRRVAEVDPVAAKRWQLGHKAPNASVEWQSGRPFMPGGLLSPHRRLSGFMHCSTLSSEYFARFPYGTCALSACSWYLALEEDHLLASVCSIRQTYSQTTVVSSPSRATLRDCYALGSAFPD